MDIEQISNILSNTDKAEVQYSDAQWLYLTDNNNAQYTNYVQWITTTLKMQFIDYHNSYMWIPVRLEIPAPALALGAATADTLPKPPLVAFKESVLSLIGNVVISTDQGQTLVNDINTQFINNLRLEVEHDIAWVNSEGSLLDFAYDDYLPIPALNTNTTLGGLVGPVQSPGYLAPQGQGVNVFNSSPITNDPFEFGNAQYGKFTVTATGTTSASITGFDSVIFNPATYVVSAWVAATSGGPTTTAFFNPVNAIAQVTFPNGAIGFFPYVIQPTSTTAGALLSFGGVPVTPAAGSYGLLATTYVEEAIGSSYDLNDPTKGNIMTVPLLFTVTVSTGAIALTSIGGVTISASTFTVPVEDQPGNRNPNYNKGFKDRITIFQNSSSYSYYPIGMPPTSGTANTNGYHQFNYICVIPNKLIHDFWMQLDIPIINVGFNIQYFFAQPQGNGSATSYPPFMTSNNGGNAPGTSSLSQNELILGGADYTQRPNLFYGQSASGGSGCRLYYRSVKMQPSDNAAMAQKLTSGFTKSIKFIATDWIIPPNNIVTSSTSTSQYFIEQSVVHPLRVWVLAYPNNATITTNNVAPNYASPVGSFLQSNVYAPGSVFLFINTLMAPQTPKPMCPYKLTSCCCYILITFVTFHFVCLVYGLASLPMSISYSMECLTGDKRL